MTSGGQSVGRRREKIKREAELEMRGARSEVHDNLLLAETKVATTETHRNDSILQAVNV